MAWEELGVSDTCQINDLDHAHYPIKFTIVVSDTCQINDLDHGYARVEFGA